jgi:hypothetical protein
MFLAEMEPSATCIVAIRQLVMAGRFTLTLNGRKTCWNPRSRRSLA